MRRVNHRCKVSKYGRGNPPTFIVMKELSDGTFIVLCPRCKERWLVRNQLSKKHTII